MHTLYFHNKSIQSNIIIEGNINVSKLSVEYGYKGGGSKQPNLIYIYRHIHDNWLSLIWNHQHQFRQIHLLAIIFTA